jgi:hypothetical protein
MNTITISGRFIHKPTATKLSSTGVAVAKGTLLVKKGLELLCVAFGSTARLMATVQTHQTVTLSGSLAGIYWDSADNGNKQQIEMVVRSLGFAEDADVSAAVAALQQIRTVLGGSKSEAEGRSA